MALSVQAQLKKVLGPFAKAVGLDIKKLQDNKQDKLKAGANVQIAEDGTISATGPGEPADLSSYSTTAQVTQLIDDKVASYVQTSTLDTKLADYVETNVLNSKLADYTTKAELTTKLADVATNDSVDTKLSSYETTANLTAKLANYTTNEALTTKLADYATLTALSSYMTTETVNNTLANYATTAALTTKLADYTTTADLNTKLADYTTTQSLTTTLEAYAKTAEVQPKLTPGNGIAISEQGEITSTVDLTGYVKEEALDLGDLDLVAEYEKGKAGIVEPASAETAAHVEA